MTAAGFAVDASQSTLDMDNADVNANIPALQLHFGLFLRPVINDIATLTSYD